MDHVFGEEIKDLGSWAKVFQSIPAFEALINKIFEKEGLACGKISHLTPGTNAVFMVDDLVVKIFAPVESGFDSETDYRVETAGMERAIRLGIHVPNVIASSFISDRYFFRYMIMDHIEGAEAKDVIHRYPPDQKIAFVQQLKDNILKLNTPFESDAFTVDVKERALANTRWDSLPPPLTAQMRELLQNRDMTDKVYVHGDITGDNVIVSPGGKLYIIDFADGRIAPKEYEYPPILFDLLDFDKIMIGEFMRGPDSGRFAEECFYGILMHEFGFEFIRLICQRLLGIQPGELKDLEQVKDALARFSASE
jgi:serine/threonine protein kinase